MDVYVARQPVLDLRKKTYGYELLFRDGMTNAFPNIDGDTATSKVLSNSFLSIGIDQITGSKKAFVNFSSGMLIKKIPLMFPNEKITVEVLEDVKPEKDIIAACKEIRTKGYDLALDDFFYKPGMEPLISLASIIKIDFMATPVDKIKEMVDVLSKFKISLLAEKLETYEDFNLALDMGFRYFQGYFFSKPEILTGKDIAPSKLTLLQILAKINQEGFNFVEVEKLVAQDVSMSYKLLRYINSAYFRRIQEITSIKHAIVLLGEREVRRFISLMGLATLADDKPDELINASILRAKFYELLAKNSASGFDPSELFTLGLFSFIDAIMDDDLKTLMENLPLSSDIKSALVDKKGPLANFVHLADFYDTGDWPMAHKMAEGIGVKYEIVPELYLEAIGWADSLGSTQ